MMNVEEYASSVDLSVAEVLKKAGELGIEVKKASDELSEDDVIILDNAINLISTDNDTTIEDEEEIDEIVEDIMESNNLQHITDHTKKQKLKKRSEIQSNKEEYFNRRKEMYKHKENNTQENNDKHKTCTAAAMMP